MDTKEGAPTKPLIIDLSRIDGNAFSIIAAISKALRNAGASKEYINGIQSEMTSSDYDHLLQIALREINKFA